MAERLSARVKPTFVSSHLKGGTLMVDLREQEICDIAWIGLQVLVAEGMKAATLTRASRLSTCPFVIVQRTNTSNPLCVCRSTVGYQIYLLGKNIVPGFWLTGNGKWFDRKRLYLFDIADGTCATSCVWEPGAHRQYRDHPGPVVSGPTKERRVESGKSLREYFSSIAMLEVWEKCGGQAIRRIVDQPGTSVAEWEGMVLERLYSSRRLSCVYVLEV